MNSIQIGGRLIADIELKTSDSGKEYTRFTLAENYYADGKQKTNWYSCVAFGHTAKALYEYTNKGTYLNIHGEIKQEKQNDKTYYKIWVNKVDFVTPASKDKKENGYDENDEEDFPF